MSTEQKQPEDLKLDYRKALAEIEQLINVYPKIGRILFLRLKMKYGTYKP